MFFFQQNAAAESGQVDTHQKQQQQQEERSQTSGGGNFLREIGHQVQQALLNFGGHLIKTPLFGDLIYIGNWIENLDSFEVPYFKKH